LTGKTIFILPFFLSCAKEVSFHSAWSNLLLFMISEVYVSSVNVQTDFLKIFVLFESFFVFSPSNKQIHKNKEASTLTSQLRPVRKPGEEIYD